MAKSPASIYPPPATKGANGDLIDRLTTDGNGNLNVNIAGGGGSGGTSSTDETPFVVGETAGTPMMGEDPTSGDLLVVALSPGTRKLATDAATVPDETLFVAGSTKGQPLLAYDPTSGELLVVETTPGTRKLAVDAAVTVTPSQTNTITAPTQVTVGSVTPVKLLDANPARLKFTVQNNGVTVMKILKGTGTLTQANYTYSLAAGGTANDGSSRIVEDTEWLGQVWALSSGAGGLVNVSEETFV